MKVLDLKRLPRVVSIEHVPCVRISLNNEKDFNLVVGEVISIQYVKNDKDIITRTGRVKTFNLTRGKQHATVVLDCSKQFSEKIIEIRISDIIDASPDPAYVFTDYSDRITEIGTAYLKDEIRSATIPLEQGKMVTEEEQEIKRTNPDLTN